MHQRGDTTRGGHHVTGPAGPGGTTVHRLVLPLLLTGVLTVSACANPPSGPANPQTGVSRSEVTSATSVVPASPTTGVSMSMSPSSDPGVPTPVTTDLPGLGTVTLAGTVTEGVERGCVVLVDGAGTTLATLLGFDTGTHPFGTEVTVTGRWAKDRVSFCQQGPLLEVRTVG